MIISNMMSRDILLYESDFLAKLTPFCEELTAIFSQDRGARIGQSTVCSQKMHTCHPGKPEEVHIMQNIDAGQAFYHRQEKGSIYHLDIFHETGLIDHRCTATEIVQWVELYNKHYDGAENGSSDKHHIHVKSDCIDIQTGTGGGRITGSLDYGKKLSLRHGHMNHVHLTMHLPSEHLACLVYIIMAVEMFILSCNLELRCNEKIKNIKGVSHNKADVSAYAETSDSLLQENNRNQFSKAFQQNEGVMDLSDELSTEWDFGKKSTNRNDEKKISTSTSGVNRHRAECLVQEGIIDLHDNERKLVQQDKQRSYLERYLPEIENHLREVVQKSKSLFKRAGKNRILQGKMSGHGQQIAFENVKAGTRRNELAISQTISAVARRMIAKQEKLFQITHADLQYFIRQKKRKIEFCLLIDASASMQGQRIEVAKILARYLVFSTTDRISVIVFQENRAWVQVPFTRDVRQMEQGLADISAYGETPLALGLTACLQYIEKTKADNPLIIVITDGVPTSALTNSDPIYDALQVAKRIKNEQYGFTCIGLHPYLDYLKQLSEVAGGSIYIVDELGRYALKDSGVNF